MAKQKTPAVQTATPAPAAKPAKPTTVTVAAKASTVTKAEPAIQAPASAKLVWLVTENPKRPGSASAERFAGYMGAKTVEEYLAKGGTRADLRWDASRKFFEIK